MLESDKLEFKHGVTENIIKEVIAFANTNGGTIIVGYNDDGTVNGIENAKSEVDRISNMLHDGIEPNIDFLVNSRVETQEGKDIIIIEVLRGTNKPYFIKKKGMTSSGVYIRFGATSQPATNDAIREMIIESTGVNFEKNISVNQDLTFNYATRVFNENGLKFGKIEQKNLGIINDKEMYTNLGLLLSDECPYTIKLAVYPDNTKVSFLDTKETKQGCILEQIEDAYHYLKINNKTKSDIVGLERIDKSDYNDEVLRECLLNSVGHRDYEIPGSILIHIFKDNIEFLSLGGLVKGLTIDDIKLGSSSSRNPLLINIFHRLGLVEAYGSGIPRIMEVYEQAINKPIISVAPHSFLIKIPKLEYKDDNKAIIDYLKKNKKITREEVEKVLNIKKMRAINILNDLIKQNIIVKTGKARNISYQLKEG